ncbi:MAG TPA: TasA family protein [Mycobacteriales bacterium]|nr:TasA family protein [Mycobacteriales bacterium]
MNRRLLMGAATIGSAATLVTAASFASFNDTESIGTKTFNAGTLDLQKTWSQPLSATNLQPGDVRSFDFTLRNAGSLDGDLKMKIVDLVDSENGVNDVEAKLKDTASAGELSKYVTVKVEEIRDDHHDGRDYGRPGGPPPQPARVIYDGNLRSSVNVVREAGDLRHGDDCDYKVTLTFVKDKLTDAFDVQAQNDAQGDGVSFDLKFALVQENA